MSRGPRADKGNAHIRKETKREAPEVLTADIARLMDDPAFSRMVDQMRDRLIAELENIKHDGAPETFAYEQEVCRTLRTLKALRRNMSLSVQGAKLKLANQGAE